MRGIKMTSIIVLTFLLGIGILIYGFVCRKDKSTKKKLIASGAVLLVGSLALGLFLFLVLIPVM